MEVNANQAFQNSLIELVRTGDLGNIPYDRLAIEEKLYAQWIDIFKVDFQFLQQLIVKHQY